MEEKKPGPNFWLGNAVLIVALVILLYIGPLWERFGVIAMVMWVIVAGFGAYLLMSDKSGPKGPG